MSDLEWKTYGSEEICVGIKFRKNDTIYQNVCINFREHRKFATAKKKLNKYPNIFGQQKMYE